MDSQVDIFYVSFVVASDEQAESLARYLLSHGVQAVNMSTEVTLPMQNPSEMHSVLQLRHHWDKWWEHHESVLFELPVYVKK